MKETINKIKGHSNVWENMFANNVFDTGLNQKYVKNSYNSTPKNKHYLKIYGWIHCYFSKEDIQMTNTHEKMLNITIIIKGMQIKSIMRFHLTSIQMVNIKKMRNNIYQQGCGKKGNLCAQMLRV